MKIARLSSCKNFVSKRKKSNAWGYETRSPATAGKANRPLLFLEHRIPMPELFTELRFSVFARVLDAGNTVAPIRG